MPTINDMRANLATSIGVVSAAALLLPLVPLAAGAGAPADDGPSSTAGHVTAAAAAPAAAVRTAGSSAAGGAGEAGAADVGAGGAGGAGAGAGAAGGAVGAGAAHVDGKAGGGAGGTAQAAPVGAPEAVVPGLGGTGGLGGPGPAAGTSLAGTPDSGTSVAGAGASRTAASHAAASRAGATAASPRPGPGTPAGAARQARVPGSTQSLTFAGGAGARDGEERVPGGSAGASGPAVQEIAARDVRPYSMLGVVWERGEEELRGSVLVRTRDAETGRWSAWRKLDAHSGDAPGAGTPEAKGGQVRGATAPLWVGDADGVQARVVPAAPAPEAGRGHDRTAGNAQAAHGTAAGHTGHGGAGEPRKAAASSRAGLPKGLRLELIDPGPEPENPAQVAPGPGNAPQPPAPGPATGSAQPREDTASAAPGGSAAPREGADAAEPREGAAPGDDTGPRDDTGNSGTAEGENPLGPLSSAQPQQPPKPQQPPRPQPQNLAGQQSAAAAAAAAEAARGVALPALTAEATRAEYASSRPFVGPRPRIVTRKGWGADERIREKGHAYTKSVRVAFVHHTAMSNKYRCAQAPSIIRGMYRYHVLSSKWRDIGYNFLVDKCGTVYEGRAGGVAKPVMGAHTYGFNTNSTGIAVLGSFGKTAPPAAAVDAVSRLTAWKLGLFGVNPNGTTMMRSGGGTKYKKGKHVRFRTISGHRDGFNTACPGARLYKKLGTARVAAARMQGR